MNRLHATALAVVLSFATTWSSPAAAGCTTDTDCPGPTCGGAVCQWSVGVHTCVAAGTDPPGVDGWCASDADCKCATQGATCVAATSRCSFTVSQDAGSTPASTTDAGDSASNPAAGCALDGGPGSPGPPSILACAAALALLLGGRRTRRVR